MVQSGAMHNIKTWYGTIEAKYRASRDRSECRVNFTGRPILWQRTADKSNIMPEKA